MFKNINEINRQRWIKRALAEVPAGLRILDAGAGELKNRQYCEHLDYVSQDFCQYQGAINGERFFEVGLQTKSWDTKSIDLVSDITKIPSPDDSFDVILCSEVLEHVPEPTHALDEFTRLLKPGGKLILTAPFISLVHMAPYHFCTGFSRYWYEHHLPERGFQIIELSANGDWHAILKQEISRLGGMEKKSGGWLWPLAYVYSVLGGICLKLFGKKKKTEDLACFGWHCIAVKSIELNKLY